MWPPPRTLCAAQPHPLRFVWAFLSAGLLRAHRDAAADGRELRSAQRAGLALAADWLSCRAFSAAFARAPPSARGAVLAWLATLVLVALPVRTAAAALLWRWLPPETAPRPRPRLLHAASTLALAVAASSLLFLLAMVVLKRELDERGLAADAAQYAWLIATFFLGVIVSPCYRADAADATPPDGYELAASAPPPAAAPPLPLPPSAPPRPPVSPARASLVVDTLEAGGAAAPWTCSAVALGAVGVAPALGLGWIERRLAHALRPGGACDGRPEMVALPSGGLQRARRTSPPLRRALAPLVAVVALAACYVGAVRRAAPPSEDGPFVACDDDAAAAAATATTVELGGRTTIFSLLYGRRTLRVPAASSVACRRGGGRGIVVAADGSQRKYADTLYAALANVRVSLRSQLPIEVFHVGPDEAFAPAAAARLRALGGVSLIDVLPRLAPAVRVAAARRLRSFAIKPFAMLASSFDVVLLIDTNVLFFARPEALFEMPSFKARGVQLFRDYVTAFRVLDPWVVSEYVGDGAAALDAYAALTGGAEVDSSVVVVDKARAWEYLHLVCALNWWAPLFWRHSWGDKDTWALAALAAHAAPAAAAVASTEGSRVGWMTRDDGGGRPTAVWGHMQFRAAAAAADELLYLNWQPHYAAGHFELGGGAARALRCCVFLEDHWAGPHDEPHLAVRDDGDGAGRARAAALAATLNATAAALRAVGADTSGAASPHWWGQVRYRRCLIYWALLYVGGALLVAEAARAIVEAGRRGSERRAAKDRNF